MQKKSKEIQMQKIIEDWKKNAKKREENNFLFIRSLKMRDSKPVNQLAKKLHKEAFEKIDCLECGNCCKHSKPFLDEADMLNIAEYLKISVEEVKEKYMELDKDKDWTFNALPCPFLGESNECQIYPARPKDCKGFPHTDKEGFAQRSYGHSYNTTVCPAVYYIVEQMKRRI